MLLCTFVSLLLAADYFTSWFEALYSYAAKLRRSQQNALHESLIELSPFGLPAPTLSCHGQAPNVLRHPNPLGWPNS